MGGYAGYIDSRVCEDGLPEGLGDDESADEDFPNQTKCDAGAGYDGLRQKTAAHGNCWLYSGVQAEQAGDLSNQRQLTPTLATAWPGEAVHAHPTLRDPPFTAPGVVEGRACGAWVHVCVHGGDEHHLR